MLTRWKGNAVVPGLFYNSYDHNNEGKPLSILLPYYVITVMTTNIWETQSYAVIMDHKLEFRKGTQVFLVVSQVIRKSKFHDKNE